MKYVLVCVFLVVACTSCSIAAPLSPTLTPTPEPTITATPDPYVYDKSRLNNTFTDYADFVAHPEKVAWAPYDPWIQPEEFNSWLHGEFTADYAALVGGDLDNNEGNVFASGGGYRFDDWFNGLIFQMISGHEQPFIGQPIYFGVIHNSEHYPVLVFCAKDADMGEHMGNHAVLLYDGTIIDWFDVGGLDTIGRLNTDNKINGVYLWKGTNVNLPDEINQLLALGFDAFANGYAHTSAENDIEFGPGFFVFK